MAGSKGEKKAENVKNERCNQYMSTQLTSQNPSICKKDKGKRKSKIIAESMESNEIYIDLDQINPLDKQEEMTHRRIGSQRVSQCFVEMTPDNIQDENCPFK